MVGSAGAVGAGGRVRAGWGDEPTHGTAGGAGAAAAERGVVAGVADRSLGPSRGRWAVRAAVRADRGGLLARSGCRPVPVRSRTNTAGVAGSGCRPPRAVRKQPSQMSGIPSWARRAIRRVRPHRPQGRWGRSAHRAQNRPVLCVAAGDRFDHTTPGAGRGELPSPAPGADPTGRRAGQRLPGAPAPGAGRVGQVRAAGPEFADQRADHRRRPDQQRGRVGGQRRGQGSGDRRLGQPRRRPRRPAPSPAVRVGGRDRRDDPRLAGTLCSSRPSRQAPATTLRWRHAGSVPGAGQHPGPGRPRRCGACRVASAAARPRLAR